MERASTSARRWSMCASQRLDESQARWLVRTQRSRDSGCLRNRADGWRGAERRRRDHTRTTPARLPAAATAATTACLFGVGLVAQPSGFLVENLRADDYSVLTAGTAEEAVELVA